MFLVTFNPNDDGYSSKFWYIPEENEEEFLKEAGKLVGELRWKLRTAFMDILVGHAVKDMYVKKLSGIQEITEYEAKEAEAKLWVGLPAEFISACFNKNKPIKTPNGWLFT